MNQITYGPDGHARSFEGPEAVNVFAMAAIASALRLYAKTGIKANRAYTPTAMLRAAAHHTGQTFKRGDYLGAAAALDARVQAEKARLSVTTCPWCKGEGARWAHGNDPDRDARYRETCTRCDGTGQARCDCGATGCLTCDDAFHDDTDA